MPSSPKQASPPSYNLRRRKSIRDSAERSPSPPISPRHVRSRDVLIRKSPSSESLASDEEDKTTGNNSSISSRDNSRSRFDASVNTSKQINEIPTRPGSNKSYTTLHVLSIFLLVLGICIVCLFNIPRTCNMGTAESVFSEESNQLQNTLEVGIGEVTNFQKPSVFLYIYKDKPEEQVNELLTHIAKFASCKLNNNQTDPIELHIDELSSNAARNNYGALIDKYRVPLHQRKVMIVQHLENIPGEVAQIFHTFCDEINPLVEEAVFIFSLLVTDFKTHDSKTVESVLRESWSNLDDDIFYPLITRMTGMIVRLD